LFVNKQLACVSCEGVTPKRAAIDSSVSYGWTEIRIHPAGGGQLVGGGGVAVEVDVDEGNAVEPDGVEVKV
jgi:hypothetical protein